MDQMDQRFITAQWIIWLPPEVASALEALMQVNGIKDVRTVSTSEELESLNSFDSKLVLIDAQYSHFNQTVARLPSTWMVVALCEDCGCRASLEDRYAGSDHIAVVSESLLRQDFPVAMEEIRFQLKRCSLRRVGAAPLVAVA